MVFQMVQWMRKGSRTEEVLVVPLHGSRGSRCQLSYRGAVKFKSATTNLTNCLKKTSIQDDYKTR